MRYDSYYNLHFSFDKSDFLLTLNTSDFLMIPIWLINGLLLDERLDSLVKIFFVICSSWPKRADIKKNIFYVVNCTTNKSSGARPSTF